MDRPRPGRGNSPSNPRHHRAGQPVPEGLDLPFEVAGDPGAGDIVALQVVDDDRGDLDDNAFEEEEGISAKFERLGKLSSTMPSRLGSAGVARKAALNKTLNAKNTGNNATLTESKNLDHHKSLNKINKFFRSLFRLNGKEPGMSLFIVFKTKAIFSTFI